MGGRVCRRARCSHLGQTSLVLLLRGVKVTLGPQRFPCKDVEMVPHKRGLSPSRPTSARDFCAEVMRGQAVALLQGSTFTRHHDVPPAQSSSSTRDRDNPVGSCALVPRAGSLSATAEAAAQATGMLLQGRSGR